MWMRRDGISSGVSEITPNQYESPWIKLLALKHHCLATTFEGKLVWHIAICPEHARND